MYPLMLRRKKKEATLALSPERVVMRLTSTLPIC